ncbi:MAG TPA: 2-oxoglutarate dehydrogenase complex dihydrolipoyllysine-residue succinyltransferase [Vicinamibacterales bacterium]|nr:2-oxoglutarate dehydrogenase complex dihydrolipoyllysine-residue succinyltransferase [Vicinamibacterales bacterium]
MSIEVVVPEVGESIVEARVSRWLKREGDRVTAGEALVELETDKIDVEVSAPRAGVLARIAHGEGEDVKIGQVLGTIDEGPGGKAPEVPVGHAPEVLEPPAPEVPAATPSARRLARERDVPLEKVEASGPRVTKADVERAAAAPSGASKAAGPASVAKPAAGPPSGERREERVRMSKRRATIARRLVEAQQTAALLTTFNEVDMSAVMALRARHKESFKARHGVSIGIVSFFVKAVVGALREFPRLNAEIQGDEMVLKHFYDIGIAVGADEGLVVPVLRDADRMSFAGIESTIRGYADKVTSGTLTLDDLRGGTFSITNGGVYGSLLSTPILNPPQVGILGLHAITDRPVNVEGQVALRPMMYTALTYDHRIVDGSEAVRFLVRIRELVEDPGALLFA